jgi:hypothetical protein
MYTIPLAPAFGNHQTLETFKVVPIQANYDVPIPAWYLKRHKAQ